MGWLAVTAAAATTAAAALAAAATTLLTTALTTAGLFATAAATLLAALVTLISLVLFSHPCSLLVGVSCNRVSKESLLQRRLDSFETRSFNRGLSWQYRCQKRTKMIVSCSVQLNSLVRSLTLVRYHDR